MDLPELPVSQLRRRLDPATLPFATTAEVAGADGTIGQPRADAALEFGLEMPAAGYNLYISGAPGSGRWSAARDRASRLAGQRPASACWIYVHNFEQPDRPRALRLPAGSGRALATDMERFVERARSRIRQAFDDEAYTQREHEVVADIAARRRAELDELERFAMDRGFAVQVTPGGMVTVPLRGGRPLEREAVDAMSDAERADLDRRGEQINSRASTTLHRFHQLDGEAADRVRSLNVEVARFAIAPLIDELRRRYAAEASVLDHLAAVADDVPDNIDAFRSDEQPTLGGLPIPIDGAASLNRYLVNVLVDDGASAPVVSESNPTYYNLIGRVEYRTTLGMLHTDFHQIRAGALHRANGGYLILDALDVIRNPFAWEALKRALQLREVRIENLAEQVTLVPTETLQPEPIPLDVKVILVGTPQLYGILYEADELFRELFKVKVDFAPDMRWNEEALGVYAAFVARHVREAGLRHLDRGAFALVVEHSARLREHQGRLTTRLIEVADLLAEADFCAARAGHQLIAAGDVEAARERRRFRSDLVEERVQEMISEGTVMIDVEGGRTGQVNGLSVIDLGDHRFGLPARITASVSVGRGSLVSVEREIKLSGPIHSKGFLIISGYLAEQYGQHRPLAMQATLTFEQSYSEVEGDSASSAELYALLSALSGLEVDQGIAVTGSVDQRGEVQAVGGVTDKIEGFFRTCRDRGLSGRQGVIVPAANVPHLMLSEAVLEAVGQGRFHVWAVRTIDEGITLLTGRPAGVRSADGQYPEGTVHRRVADRLDGYAEVLRSLAAAADDGLGPGRSPAGAETS